MWRGAGEIERLRGDKSEIVWEQREPTSALHDTRSNTRAVNKKDESETGGREEPCSLLPGLASMAAWL